MKVMISTDMTRKYFYAIVIACLPLALSAQTQQGYVKTKGRMVNGRYVAGQGLPGATVNIQGGNSIGVKNANGSFSFVVPAKTFMVQSVQKKGYELVDADALRKSYQHSANPLYLVMETPEQQMEDLLEAQEQISKTLREQLKKSRQEIQRLKDENKITEEDYRQRLAKLMEDQQNSQKLIADMAKEYSQMDYDQMNSLNQRISDAILNGRLMEADSLLRSKGDMKGRIAEVRKEQQAEAQEEQELAQRQENLEASKKGTKKKLEDIAADCYKFFDRFKLENKHDSAAYYIELRAELDTTNARWQFDAASYLYDQNQFRKSSTYYERALETYRRLAKLNPQAYESDVAATLNNLAILYSITRRFEEGEAMYKETLEIYRHLAKSNPQAYEPDVAGTLDNLAILYYSAQRFTESMTTYMEALEIRRRLAQSNPQAFAPEVARTLNNLASLCYSTWHFTESETIFKESLEIRRRLAESNPQAYEPDVAATLNNLANLYKDTQRFTEGETMYEEALEIYRRLVLANPQAYEPDMAQTLNNLAGLYTYTQRYTESEAMFKEALETYRRLAQSNPQVYAHDVALTLGNMAYMAIFTKRHAEAERLSREGLANDSTQHWIASNLAAALLFQGEYAEAEKIYRQYKDELKEGFLDDFKQFAEAGVIPKKYEADVERIKKMLEE